MIDRGVDSSAEQQKLVDAYFQSRAVRWRAGYQEATVEGAIYRERLRVALAWVDELAMPVGERILEIGCGPGVSVVPLARRGYRVDAVDSVPEMLKVTRQHAAAAGMSSSVFTSLGDAHSLAFPAGAFGLILAIGLLPHLHSPTKALGEMARVLKSGGFLLVTAGNRWRLDHTLDPWLCPALEPARRVVRAILRRSLRRPRSGPPGRRFRLGSLREVESWLSSVGLASVQAKTVGFPPLQFHYQPFLGEQTSIRLNQWLQWLADHRVAGIQSAGMDYIVLARRNGG